ncbi:uncharacterized protein FOMMEDRAFT_165789 [Fomitiporia mediterranea MF3/22]|uniref:uncharacterized protein n=1 Tax=Fomitiporia mediterranea (strain MF3/22) TaxID=694068 RepID=UPI0004407901|nr:uncharacterized protein FOMMEDRAFT_165789 [Fomitiporia mediterranea MF3/22]EJD05329.1 hypothetical protein FOMMEDRAFT_165789 [Fomitiporia mediterranea MF3/22]
MAETSSLEEFAAYPFHSDQAFQDGLTSILNAACADGSDSEGREDVIGRAKAFYFSSVTGHQISWDDVRNATERKSSEDHAGNIPGPNDVAQNESRVLSFTEITALIESDRTHLIPNNESISGGVNDDRPSESKEKPRRKPWELQSNPDPDQS